MSATVDDITLRFPRSAVADVSSMSKDLLTRMHLLLERNTDGALTPLERAELETLAQMAQFSQLLAAAMGAPAVA